MPSESAEDTAAGSGCRSSWTLGRQPFGTKNYARWVIPTSLKGPAAQKMLVDAHHGYEAGNRTEGEYVHQRWRSNPHPDPAHHLRLLESSLRGGPLPDGP